jgi:hypothetical protein
MNLNEIDPGYTPHWSDADLASIYTNGTATHIELTLALEDLLHVRKALRATLSRVEAERDGLRARLGEWEAFRSGFENLSYHYEGMGCGIEDRGITDRYAACEHGWDCAMERVAEWIPEETPTTTEGEKP